MHILDPKIERQIEALHTRLMADPRVPKRGRYVAPPTVEELDQKRARDMAELLKAAKGRSST